MASVDNLVNLHEDDLLLIAQEENGQYVNKNVTIKQLIEELQLDYVVQKGTIVPAERHGIVMPGPTMDYDNATGELNVNFDTQSLRFLRLHQKRWVTHWCKLHSIETTGHRDYR